MRDSSTPTASCAAGVHGLRARLPLVAALASALAFAAPAAAQRLPEGAQVATLRLGAPAVDAFVLHGTVPVPRGVFPLEEGGAPFHVLDSDGTLVPAQVETVSRYPYDADGADVVEILARVHRPPDTTPGARLEYQVITHAHRATDTREGALVRALLDVPRALVARGTDAFGHVYAADLYEDVRLPIGDRYRVLRAGVAATTEATHQMLAPLAPQSGPQATLPHLMGVHAYVTRYRDEEFLTLDLRVHNAASGLDPLVPLDDALQKLYFGTFELELPREWVLLTAEPDPFLGAPYDEGAKRVWPVVAPLPNGALHLLPQMGQFERRFAIAHDDPETIAHARSALRQEGLGFATRGENAGGFALWSWWNEDTARYFPQRRRMPELTDLDPAAQRADDQIALDARLAQVQQGAAGTWPATSQGLGWAHPWGITDGGMVGGEEIWLYDGITTAWSASTAGYRLAALRHRMYTDRQRNVLFNLGGLPTAVHQWTEEHAGFGTTLPIWWFNGPLLWAADPFGFSNAPLEQVNWVVANGKTPPYESELLAFGSIDEAHLVRYTHDAKVLAWLGNDALAKEDLRAQADAFHLGYTEFPQDVWNGTIVSGLRASEVYVASHPGNGLAFGRREGWCLDAVSAAFSTQNDAWRNRARSWLERVIAAVEAGQSTCNGTMQATLLYNVFNAQYRCRQSIEAAIGEHGLVALRESVFGRDNPTACQAVNRVLDRSCRAMLSPLFWSSTAHAPWSLIAVGPGDSTQPLFCTFIPQDGNSGFTDAYQCWSSFAYGYEVTGDPVFLSKAQEMLGQNLRAGLEQHAQENLANRAALLELVQRLQ